jgi:putative peptidoglycan lipid II flippase
MKTASALLCYSVGLWAIAGARTLVPAFYALQDTWTPLKIGLICLGANVVLNSILIFPLKHAGLALATSLSSVLNLILLCRAVSLKLGGMDLREVAGSLLRIFFCSLPMGFVSYLICSSGDWSTSGQVVPKVVLLGCAMVAGLGIYVACCYLMKIEEFLFLVRMLKKKR